MGRPPDDAQLAERARRGDDRAFEELLRRHQTIAFRTAYLITGAAADAEDAVQEAALKAHAALPRFDPARPFRPWLLAIVANEARNRRRAARAGGPACALRARRRAGRRPRRPRPTRTCWPPSAGPGSWGRSSGCATRSASPWPAATCST